MRFILYMHILYKVEKKFGDAYLYMSFVYFQLKRFYQLIFVSYTKFSSFHISLLLCYTLCPYLEHENF